MKGKKLVLYRAIFSLIFCCFDVNSDFTFAERIEE